MWFCICSSCLITSMTLYRHKVQPVSVTITSIMDRIFSVSAITGHWPAVCFFYLASSHITSFLLRQTIWTIADCFMNDDVFRLCILFADLRPTTVGFYLPGALINSLNIYRILDWHLSAGLDFLNCSNYRSIWVPQKYVIYQYKAVSFVQGPVFFLLDFYFVLF